jgi:predicted AAA+ superfamily ATPase
MNRSLLKRRLVEQKEEADLILDQNLVKRQKQDELLKTLDAPLVKVIIGPRRSGKTVLSLQAEAARETEYYYINFDDEILGSIVPEEFNLLLELLIELFGKKNNLVLDEVQNVDKWELFVNRLLRANYNIILTGSNSKLLSKELSSALTGRSLTIELFPFSFEEYLETKGILVSADKTDTTAEIAQMRKNLNEYMETGGFPEVLLRLKDRGLQQKYLRELFDATIKRDVAHRYKIRFTRELIECAYVITSNFARRTSFRKLSKEIGISEHTLKKYTGYLEEAYLVLSVKKFSFKALEIEKSIRKYYSPDTGYIHAKGLLSTKDSGFLMENLVAVELKRRGWEFYYYMFKDRYEIDFVIRENRKISEIIQVTHDEDGIREREVSNGWEAAGELNAERLTVITWYHEDEEVRENIRIHYIPLWKWLLKGGRARNT